MRRVVGGVVSVALLAAAVLPALPLAPGASAAPGHAAASRCPASGLSIWADKPAGNAAAGSRYYYLRFTNLSGRTCTLHGSPGVSAVSLSGSRLGPPAGHPLQRNPAQTLANGATASALLKIAVASFFAGCHPRLAAGLRVYPPGSTASKIVPLPLQVCSRASVTAVGEVGPSNGTELDVP